MSAVALNANLAATQAQPMLRRERAERSALAEAASPPSSLRRESLADALRSALPAAAVGALDDAPLPPELEAFAHSLAQALRNAPGQRRGHAEGHPGRGHAYGHERHAEQVGAGHVHREDRAHHGHHHYERWTSLPDRLDAMAARLEPAAPAAEETDEAGESTRRSGAGERLGPLLEAFADLQVAIGRGASRGESDLEVGSEVDTQVGSEVDDGAVASRQTLAAFLRTVAEILRRGELASPLQPATTGGLIDTIA